MSINEIIQYLTVILQVLLIVLLIATITAVVFAIYAVRELKLQVGSKISSLTTNVQRLLPLSLLGSPKLISYFKDNIGSKALDEAAKLIHRIRK